MELVQSANPADRLPGRVDQIDVMRGFALLGICLENIFTMHTPNAFFAEYASRYGHGLNHFLLLALMVLVRSKFYPIFSFVFGASAALGLPTQSPGFFLRRLAGLFLLGALQVIFIWEGDVLVQYVFMGCLLLLLRNWGAKPLVILGSFLLLFSFIGNLWAMPQMQVSEESLAAYETGTFSELMSFRVQEFLQSVFTWATLLFYSRIFAFMLMGFAFVKSNSISRLTSPAWVKKVFLGHLALAIGVAILVQLAGWRGEANETLWLKELCLGVYFYAAVITLASLPVLLWHTSILQRFLSPLRLLGKLTLTHYLTQNLLFSLLFYRYGLDLFNKLEPWQCVLLYVIVIALQLGFSFWCLKRYKQGPVEWLLRRIAGKKQKGAS
ncbi:DUF418 domain-containing protein [Rufibacter aurantiacus]|uniref:DUF418 domain-containing protein n=1 Tax=Rufibacter aurantiacus TaxID=2817374 RepID=UPI001B317F9D|nr:DUF418 domain-containing protein [Rufibacter aurantiacus]